MFACIVTHPTLWTVRFGKSLSGRRPDLHRNSDRRKHTARAPKHEIFYFIREPARLREVHERITGFIAAFVLYSP